MSTLEETVLQFPLLEGAVASGIATRETLAGGPPSVDLEYVLEGGRSAVVFAVAMDPLTIAPFLNKTDRQTLEREMIRVNTVAGGIALNLANYLVNKGHRAAPVAANLMYRKEGPEAEYSPTDSVYPDLAHRFLAVRSGLGHMGRSGNVLLPSHGAAVIFAATVTDAELSPTAPLPPEENYCDDCGLCVASCASGFMDFSREERVNLGGIKYTYSARRNLARCDLVCSGYTGLARNRKWSTWSPGRFAIPEDTAALADTYKRISTTYSKWPVPPGGRIYYYTDDLLRVSCAHCQIICDPDPEIRKERFRTLTASGVVMQNEDGSLEAVAPDEAERRFAAMPAERRMLYQDS